PRSSCDSGHSGALPYLAARYRLIAIDSQKIFPSSSSTGMCPLGLSLRCSGDLALATSTGTCSYLRPSSSSAHKERAERDLDVPYNLIIRFPPVRLARFPSI